MVIGNGLIGTKFKIFNSDSVIFFASGVSNSKIKDIGAVIRERELLTKTIVEHPDKLFVYFSTYSIEDPILYDNMYVKHKIDIETFIKAKAKQYLIIRTSNIVGPNSKNPHTIINFLVSHIKNSISFELWKNSFRNILDLDHLYQMVLKVIEEKKVNETLYLINPISLNMLEIVSIIERFLNKKANCQILEFGSYFEVDKYLSTRLFSELNISLENYLLETLNKYY